MNMKTHLESKVLNRNLNYTIAPVLVSDVKIFGKYITYISTLRTSVSNILRLMDSPGSVSNK